MSIQNILAIGVLGAEWYLYWRHLMPITRMAVPLVSKSNPVHKHHVMT